MTLNNLFKLRIFALITLSVFCFGCEKEIDYRIGADISFVPQLEADGMTHYDENDNQKDVLEILKDHHFNNIRLRLFVDPKADNGYSDKGFCDLEHTVAMARRIKDAGMEFTLDFHYSDTWADPDKQFKPSAWQNATGKVLQDSVYNYTKKVLQRLDKEGVAPDIIQIGNEINHGMIWPEGKVMDYATEEDWERSMGLYKSGQKAVREILPESKIMVHLALGGQNRLSREFLNQMKNYGAEYDIIGLSYYEKWHGTYDDLKRNVYDLAETFEKPIAICEYGANEDNVKIINDIVRSIPNGLGFGTMAWEPTRAFFDKEGKASGEMLSIYNTIYAQYADSNFQPEVQAPYERTVDLQKPIIGADISFVPQMEARGITYSDNGTEKDVVEILKDNRFNFIRLRLFVDPTTENGYSKDGFGGLEKTLEMAKRVKAAGLDLLLDFHYSDTWADPGKQFKPASWEGLEGSALEGQVYSYTNDVIKRFIEEGVRPEMVQVGNEIHNGMIWPDGKIEGDSAESFSVLLRGASAAVRAADPSINIMIHIAKAHDLKNSIKFFDKIIARDVIFDIIGQSYYPEWHGELEPMEANMIALAKRYQMPIIIAEYKEHKKEVNEIMKNLPNGLGLGTFIWEATSPRWGDLFDSNGATNENMKIYHEFYDFYSQ